MFDIALPEELQSKSFPFRAKLQILGTKEVWYWSDCGILMVASA
jgi:hypothetical protein